jgi:DNA repair ATPase RecN
MTQEELDALMSSAGDDLDALEDELNEEISDDDLADILGSSSASQQDEDDEEQDPTLPPGYNSSTAHHWPLPATDENKMVHQLDDVTKESEEKASEIFDIIEGVSNNLMEKEEALSSIIEVLNSNVELFTTLNAKFPDVKAFAQQLEKNTQALDEANTSLEVLQESGEAIMNVMDIMQYQDIHRQKN